MSSPYRIAAQMRGQPDQTAPNDWDQYLARLRKRAAQQEGREAELGRKDMSQPETSLSRMARDVRPRDIKEDDQMGFVSIADAR